MDLDALTNAAAARCGIEPVWHDIWGERHEVSQETLRALLAASGFDVSSPQRLVEQLREIEAAESRRVLPATVVTVPTGEPLRLPWTDAAGAAPGRVSWRLELEGGERLEGGGSDPNGLVLPGSLPLGYHALLLEGPGGLVQRVRLILTPGSCHVPSALAEGGRGWGPAVQLYAVRSGRNWGIGDFEDLARLAELFGREGAQMVGANPLHALFPDQPERASPYAPSSRLFLNVLLIDVESVPELAGAGDVRRELADPAFERRLAELRQVPFVDYATVGPLKLATLRRLFEVFRRWHRNGEDTARGRAFEAYLQSGGEDLRRHALFEAIQAHERARDPGVYGWPRWPEPLQSVDSEATRRFELDHPREVEFYAWLQWEADRQLQEAAARGARAGLGLGLYLDLALGASPDGSEVWTSPGDYAHGANAGSPPDDFNLRGQDWGLPPLVPRAMRDSGYSRFARTLRATMRRAGAIRIDHVMQLMRLFWVPQGAEPTQGAYVRYPFQDLLGVLALESQREQCLVVGEDLGTVPDEVREALGPAGVLSYRVLYFEREQDGAFKRPERYPRQALATVSNHDLPTFAGYWSARDIDTRERVGAFPTESWPDEQRRQRGEDRERLLTALREEGLLSEVSGGDQTEPPSAQEVSAAAHQYVARSEAELLTIQLEDVSEDLDQVNLPGTSEAEHPNWRRKLGVTLEDLPADPHFRTLVERLRAGRASPDS